MLLVVVAVASGLAAGVANGLVVQAAVGRLLFSMGRDRVLPPVLARLSGRGVPVVGVLVVAAVSLVLGLALVGQVEFLSSLVSFGALTSFLVLHFSVVWYHLVRRCSRRFGIHLVVPLIGFVIVGYVLVNADVNAKVGGVTWLVIGLVVLAVRRLRSRRMAR